MTKREEALDLVEGYAWLHAGTAVTVGAFGGQFGADRAALTLLTTKMIKDICDVYEIKDRAARDIHIFSAIARLTVKGTAIASTILNYIPLGSFANGCTSFFLTRNAGINCINDIESEKMNSSNQLWKAGKDLGVIALSTSVGDFFQSSVAETCDSITKEAISLADSGTPIVEHIKDFFDQLPDDTHSVVGNAVGMAMKEAVKSSLSSRNGIINKRNMVRTVFINSIINMIDGQYNSLTKKEIEFRLLQQDEHYAEFEPFFESTAKRFDEIAKTRGELEGHKYLLSAFSDYFKVKSGLTAEKMIDSLIMDNPYDRAIAKAYEVHLKAISFSDNIESVLAKSALLYVKLYSINIEYNLYLPKTRHIDDGLLFMMADRIKHTTNIFGDKNTQPDIAFRISEYIQQHNYFFFPNVSIPLWGLSKFANIKEYEHLKSMVIAFWGHILENAISEEGAWSDCGMAAIQIHHLNSMLLNGFSSTDKNDDLIYWTASELKASNSIISKYDEKTIAYHTARYFDKYLPEDPLSPRSS